MYPPRFDYEAAEDLDRALELLAEHGDDAKVLAGGQSLVPLMKLRFAAPPLIVDLNRIAGLGYIEEDDDHLRIGALTRHAEMERSELLAERYPALAATAPLVSDPIVRNLGTVGGSLAHADPAGDWASTMLAVGAVVVARSSSGERTIPVDDLLLGTFETALTPDEILTEVRVPRPRDRSGGTYLKLERKIGDFATVGVAVQLQLDNGTIDQAGIALTAVGPRNVAVRDAEQALTGAEPGPEAFEGAAELAAAAAEPRDDVRGTAEYKRHMVRVFVRRGLQRALELARGS
jgi:aerobic carbon-monoxide dehydrogenase medium subunit